MVVCEDLNAPHLENALKTIRLYGERLEKKLLTKFEAAAMSDVRGGPDVASMRDCAASLLKFGDAVNLYNTYIYTIVAKQINTVRCVWLVLRREGRPISASRSLPSSGWWAGRMRQSRTLMRCGMLSASSSG